MKTLDQVEPRIPISQTDFPHTISSPGSYFLTENIIATSGSNGIRIDADHVTLDLNGFVVDGNGQNSATGVFISSGRENVAVLNGTIQGWSDHGINHDIRGAWQKGINPTGSLSPSARCHCEEERRPVTA